STPDHSLVVIYQETDRVALQSVRGDGFHLVAIDDARAAAHHAQHQWLARAIDVGIEEPGACALPLQGERQVHGRGRLAYTTLARGNHDDVADATQVGADIALLRGITHGLCSQYPDKAGCRMRQ